MTSGDRGGCRLSDMPISLKLLGFVLLMTGVIMLGIFIYVGMLKLRAHRLDQVKERIVGVVAAYFAKTGVAVKSEAIALPTLDHFILIVDTEPIKRFRYSHIVEMVLIEKVKEATRKTVNSVYWRFPLPIHDEEIVMATASNTSSGSHAPRMLDAYLAHGVGLLRAPEGIDVHEDSWAHFQEVVHEREEAHAKDNIDSDPRPGSV